jgi:hypothetical protein
MKAQYKIRSEVKFKSSLIDNLTALDGLIE